MSYNDDWPSARDQMKSATILTTWWFWVVLVLLTTGVVGGFVSYQMDMWNLGHQKAITNKQNEVIHQSNEYVDRVVSQMDGSIQDFDNIARSRTGFVKSDVQTWDVGQVQDVQDMCAASKTLSDDQLRQYADPRALDLMATEGCRVVKH